MATGWSRSSAPEVQALPDRRSAHSPGPVALGAPLHIDIAEVQTGEGKLCLSAGIDRTARFAVARLVATAGRKTAREFLQPMLEAVPCHVHTILTDRAIGTPLVRKTMARGIQFAEQPRNRNTLTWRPMRFDRICEASGIEHCLTRPDHPWTSGQLERMNRTIKDATVKRFHYGSRDELRTRLTDFPAACNFVPRLKTLGGHTPCEYIRKIWASQPDRSGSFSPARKHSR